MTDLEQTQAMVGALDRRIVTHQGDVRDLDDMKSFVSAGIAELGQLDIVIANAGICTPQTWDKVTPELFKDAIDVNLTGVWNTVMATAPHMVDAGRGGSIILSCSLTGKKPQPYMVHYTSSKHGVTGLCKAFAGELGQHRIRVNSLHPGAVKSPMGSEDLVAHPAELLKTYPQLATTATAFLPEWSVECEDIAAAAAFLASDNARFITAENMSIDAGMQWF